MVLCSEKNSPGKVFVNGTDSISGGIHVSKGATYSYIHTYLGRWLLSETIECLGVRRFLMR